jgi:hypothetical protein
MATIEKAEIKIFTANEIGADLEDMMEQAQKAEHMHEGAKIALADAYKKVNALADYLHKTIEDGELNLAEIDTPEKIEGLVRRYIGRCAGVIENLGLMAQNAQLGAAGMVAAYKNAMKAPMKVMEAERKKIDAVKSVLDQATASGGDPDVQLRAPPRPTGAHPGNPLADRRSNGQANPSNGAAAAQQQNEEPQQPMTVVLTGKPAELLKQVEAGLATLQANKPEEKTPEMAVLLGFKTFLQRGGDLRTKEGRELKTQALAALPKGSKKPAVK